MKPIIQRNSQLNGGCDASPPYADHEQVQPVDMIQIPLSAQVVSDAIMSAKTDAERIQIAAGMLAYSLGALAALVGKNKAAEIAYRHADATVGLK